MAQQNSGSISQQNSTHWSLSQPTKESPATKVNYLEDKTLEELVLSDLYYDIARNLPPDDVLTYMHQDDLLTDGQRDHYKMMKASHQPEMERSEYLLECLRKGEPGFLKRLCTILRKIPPSSYIAGKIEEKMMQLAMQESTLKSPVRTDRTKKPKDNTYWMSEYKKMESKTRMQLRAKDREIKRLRKAIQQLEKENNDNLQRVFSEMRNQVDVVSKWIDYKAETLPQSSALVNMALSQDVKVDDIFTGTSESSSNQSTLERPPKHHPRKKESAKSHNSIAWAPCTESNSTEKSPANHVHQQGYSDPALQRFSENVSNPPTTVESDAASDITRPLQVSELTGIEPELSMLDNGIDHSTKVISDREYSQSIVSGTALQPVYNHTALPIPAHASVMYIRGDAAVSETMQPTNGPSTPSTVKSNTASPILSLSPQGGTKPLKSAKVFKYGKERSPSSDQVDFREVFRRIRGREPPTK